MEPLKVKDIIVATGGRLVQGDLESEIFNICLDSRKASQDDLFIPLTGEKFDGHAFIDDVCRKGVAGFLYETAKLPSLSSELMESRIIVEVNNTLSALQKIAGFYLKSLAPKVIAVTGSNGKTSTKDMIFSILSQRYQVLKTEGNFNNEIGLPLTLLRLTAMHEIAVVEMGMRGLGEIAALANIAHPDVAVVTNVGESHLERLGSRDNIAKAKAELVEALDENGTAVLNFDDHFVKQMKEKSAGKTIFFGTSEEASVFAENICPTEMGISFLLHTPLGSIAIDLPVPGKHNVLNALAAVAAAISFEVELSDIKAGLEQLVPTGMRMEISELNNGVKVINDAYNASPASVKAGLQVLADIAADRRIAVLGDMLELGDYTEMGHKEVGGFVAEKGFDYLLTVGNLGRMIAMGAEAAGMDQTKIYQFDTNTQASAKLREIIELGDIIFVKGSRGMRMEEIVQGLRQ